MEQSPSFLDAVGRGILESASSLDAHIDAESLVKRISHDFSPSSRRCQQALSELKDLCRRAPTAVVAAEGSVPAILRAVSQLTPTSGEGEDIATEPLQDALEALGWLIGQGHGASPAGRLEDEAEALRAADVAELVVRHTENGKQLLRLLDVRDTSTQHDTIVLLQRVYHYQERLMSQACLERPEAVIQLMTLLECPVDYVRNECLSFLLLLTASNSELQTIVTVQGLVEIIFAILEEEDLTRGGKVARDLLQCFMNLVGNVTCQKYIRESDGINYLVAAMSTAFSGRRANANDEDDDDGYAAADRIDIPEEVRWQCFDLLADAMLAFAGGSMKSSASSHAGSAADDAGKSREAVANQEALVQKGALTLCKHLSDMQISLAPKLRLVELLEALEPTVAAAKRLQSPQKDGSGPLFSVLTAVVVGPSTVRPLRCALGRVLGRAVARHESLQHFLLDSLVPQMDFTPGEVQPAGRQLVGLLDEAAEGSAEDGRLWFAMHLLLAMLQDNMDVQSACERKAVSIPSDAGPPETFLDLVFRTFSACTRACRSNQTRSGTSLEQRSAELAPASADSGPEPEAAAAALVAILKFLVYWLASCPAALVAFACSPSHLPLAMDLTTMRSSCASFFKVQVEGLACLLLGICIKSESKDVEAASLMGLVAKHIGIEEFQEKGERLWRCEPLQRPPRGLVDFRWYGGRFRAFIRQQQRAAQRRMVQLYISGNVGSTGGAALMEDIEDHYKQLIRVQDSELCEVRKENEHLRREVESFMVRSLQASSAALVEKMEAVQAENDALHTEVEQLSSEREEQSRRIEEETRRFRNSIQELEQQLHSIAVGYEQVEHGSEAFSRENAELRAKLSVSQRSSTDNASQQTEGLELEVAGARQRIQELQEERADLLDLLGRIVTACPEARALVCPLGATSARCAERPAGGTTHLGDQATAIA